MMTGWNKRRWKHWKWDKILNGNNLVTVPENTLLFWLQRVHQQWCIVN